MNSRWAAPWLRWLPLAAVAACLNPQPDDNPLFRPRDPTGSTATEGSGPGAKAPDPTPPQLVGDGLQEPPGSNPPPPASPAAPASAGGIDADAGVPPAIDAGGDPGALVDGDAASGD